ncbi:MAG: LCP family protein [Clostridiaceae bacterium]|nr:LCP family protein [Clostridiaceae bacterium]
MRRSYSVPSKNRIQADNSADNGSRRTGRAFGYIFLAVVGLIMGVILYIFLVLGQSLRTQINIVDAVNFQPISLDNIQLTENSSNTVSWGEGGRTRVYVHPDFPIIKIDQKDPDIENVLVFGVDARTADDVVCRADSLILVTIDRKYKAIKLTSVMRDSQVDIKGRSDPDRINAAYAYGGVGLLINTLNETMDLDIQRFAMFDFWSAASLIDAVGGIEIQVTQEEVPYTNQSIQEQNQLVPEASQSPYLEKAGLLKLDGRQAVAWARIRKLDSDYVRTSRQRTVMVTLLRQVSKSQLSTLLGMANGGLNAFETNMGSSDMIRIGLNAIPLTSRIFEYRVPEDGLYTVNPDPWMMIVDWEQQTRALHEFIWGDPSH